MPARLWIVLLALLLLAAPADATLAGTVDAPPSIVLCDEGAVAQAEALPPERPPARTICTPRRADAAPPTPPLARIFRPPRPAFD